MNAYHYQPNIPVCQTSPTFSKATIIFNNDAKHNSNVSACIEIKKYFLQLRVPLIPVPKALVQRGQSTNLLLSIPGSFIVQAR